jgi:GDPmannose 4,6-dehydratase
VIVDTSLLRPIDIGVGWGNPTKARVKLGWQAQYKMQDVVRMMVEAQSISLLKSRKPIRG